MVNHGLSTGALFLVVGMVYERYHTRQFDDLGGLGRPMPWMAFFLVFFTLSSIGLPGLNGFVAEFLVLLGTLTSDANGVGPLGIIYAAFAFSGIVLSAVYMLYLCKRVLFGPLREPPGKPDLSHGLSRDLNKREIAILTPIAAACLLLGVWPNAILDSVRPATQQQILGRLYRPPPAIPLYPSKTIYSDSSANGGEESAVSGQQSGISSQQSAVSGQQAAVTAQRPAIGPLAPSFLPHPSSLSPDSSFITHNSSFAVAATSAGGSDHE
jgi:hypothetical protein